MESMRKKHDLKDYYGFCFGMGVNWVDLNEGKMYHIQEYKEAIERGEKPEGIRVSYTCKPDETLEIVGEYAVRERMKEHEPDPRF